VPLITAEPEDILMRLCMIILFEATIPLYLLISCHCNSSLVAIYPAVVAIHEHHFMYDKEIVYYNRYSKIHSFCKVIHL
jgi:hypothetical protein